MICSTVLIFRLVDLFFYIARFGGIQSGFEISSRVLKFLEVAMGALLPSQATVLVFKVLLFICWTSCWSRFIGSHWSLVVRSFGWPKYPPQYADNFSFFSCASTEILWIVWWSLGGLKLVLDFSVDGRPDFDRCEMNGWWSLVSLICSLSIAPLVFYWIYSVFNLFDSVIWK